MRSPDRFTYLTVIGLSTCMVMLAATRLAQAGALPSSGRWTYPREVSHSEGLSSKGPRLALNSMGNPHLIWTENTAGSVGLHYAKSDDLGSVWSYLDPKTTDLVPYDGAMALSAGGTLHACWCEANAPFGLFWLYCTKRSQVGWGTRAKVTDSDTGRDIRQPSIAVTNNLIHLVWSQQPVTGTGSTAWDLHYSRSNNGLNWLPPSKFADTEKASQSAAMASDRHDNLHVVWQESGTPWEIMYISGTVGIDSTVWSSPITVSVNVDATATDPDIAVGSDDTVHIVFGKRVSDEVQYVYYANFPIDDPSAVSPIMIPGSLVDVSQLLPKYPSPSIAVTGTGELHVAWNGKMGGDYYDRIYYAMSEDYGASWSDPVAISSNDAWPDGFATIATDGTLVHVGWQQQEEPLFDQDIYYARDFPVVLMSPLIFKNYP